MGDVADILSTVRTGASDGKEAPAQKLSRSYLDSIVQAENQRKKKSGQKAKAAPKPAGVSREVLALLGPQEVFCTKSLSQTPEVKRSKNGGSSSAHWKWAAFTNSARGDDAVLHHWVKADQEPSDYVFAKLNPRPYPHVQYSNDEYEAHLRDPQWSKEETDQLVALCYQFDMRWPVIFDRFEGKVPRPIVAVQERYYRVQQLLNRHHKATSGTEPYPEQEAFNFENEHNRRKQLDTLFNKTKAKEESEEDLRDQLRNLEQQIRKLKGKKDQAKQHAEDLQALSDAKKALASRVPEPGQPYLQSLRLVSQTPAQNMSKNILKKAQKMLTELGIPEHVVATKQVCDLFDALRMDILTFLALERVAKKPPDEDAAQREQHREGAAAALRPGGGLGADQGRHSPAPDIGSGLKRKASLAGLASGPPGKGKRIATKK